MNQMAQPENKALVERSCKQCVNGGYWLLHCNQEAKAPVQDELPMEAGVTLEGPLKVVEEAEVVY